MVGSSNSNDGQVTGNHGDTDCWVVKTDATGVIQWEKSLGGSGSDYGTSIEQTSDRGFIIGACSNSTDGQVSNNHGNVDFWIIKIDSLGNIIWQNSYGGTNTDFCKYVGQTRMEAIMQLAGRHLQTVRLQVITGKLISGLLD